MNRMIAGNRCRAKLRPVRSRSYFLAVWQRITVSFFFAKLVRVTEEISMEVIEYHRNLEVCEM